jgi:hypothetical protein
MLAMTPAVYTYWAEATPATGEPGAFAWALLAVLAVISAVGGSAASAVLQRSWRRLGQGDQGRPVLTPGAWGEPGLAPPS